MSVPDAGSSREARVGVYPAPILTDTAGMNAAYGLLTEAAADFNRALEINPETAYAYAGRGLVYLELGNEAAAQAEFDQALKIDIGIKLSLTEAIRKLKQKLASDKK